jgi:predicted KAP-like P-loop ATPase
MVQTESNTGKGTEILNVLSADNPLTDPNHDALGYAPFARHLADSIGKMSPPDGFVMAVYGAWGSGKSTLLNFIVYYLTHTPEGEQKAEGEQPIIVPFNPWWFSGQEDLAKRFFDQLQASLSKRLKSVGKRLIKQIDSLADRVSTIPDLRTKGFAAVVKTFIPPKDVYKLKNEVEEILRNQQKRIVVVIDDIDRLTAEEIRQLFRVIKAVANFPNVIYLLLFDKEVVVKALSEAQGIPGEAYLEKIVQVPFDLPLPDKTSLSKLLDEQLGKILTGTPEELFDESYFSKLYFAGIDYFITTPRDIVRLTNTLRVTYPAVKGEVNAADFIAIEALRVFSPLVYDIVRKNSAAFTGRVDTAESFMLSMEENFKTFHNSWLSQVQEKDRAAIRLLITRLFPRLRGVFGKDIDYYSVTQEPGQQRKQFRVSSAEIFNAYFRLTMPEGGISYAEMKAMLALAKDSRQFATKLVDLANQTRPDGTTRVREFIERIRDYAKEEIPLDCIPSILQALFEVGDQLWRLEDEQRAFFNISNEVQIEWLIGQLLKRLDKPAVFQILKEVISNGRAIATIVEQVLSFRPEHGRYGADRSKPEEERLINPQQLQELEELALGKVREAAQKDYLLQVPKLLPILYFWKDLAGEEEVMKWVKKVDNSGLTENHKTAITDFINKYDMRQQG